jgi:hypothetical protein
MALNVIVGGKLLHHPVCSKKIWVETVQLLCFAAVGGPKSQIFSNAHCTQMGKQRDLNSEEKTKALAWSPSIPSRGCFSWIKRTGD